ncbi:MAG TPA: NAD(P)H-dependent oxidoreductase subunit E [Bacteroidales bacterium]|nr:NAD(P)H-dependent oxidoreductase subunit E [Bacteroidales bacterium]
MNSIVQKSIDQFGKDKTRLMDMLLQIQDEMGYIPEEAVLQLAQELNISTVDVKQTISFYHFFACKPRGKYRVYLNNSLVAEMMGRKDVAAAFERETGCRFGSVTPDGLIGLFETSDIGMNDQEPAALINDVVFTRLTPFRVKELVKDMKAGKPVHEMFHEPLGDGQNASDLIKAMVQNNIRRSGILLNRDANPGDALNKVVKMSPEQVIKEVTESNLRGRGGAGFPTGLKWDFCSKSKDPERYVLCNADEGEPGTFKDRVLLTEYTHFIFEGMTVAGYAIGSSHGILYLRYEYKYLLNYLNNVLADLRRKNFLGKNIAGKTGFDFDIRIQLGAGAYVCGEESALIESAEGKRGEPRDRPPFPVEVGYLNKPTIINNVETLLSAVKIINHGSAWFKSFGTKDSAGTKILSVSGDCKYPGVYEVEWGFAISDLLDITGATDVQAVQVGGPSGTVIGPGEFNRIISFADMATGGSMIIIGNQRDLLRDVVLNFMDFFIEESCGSCSTCRNFPVVMRRTLIRIIEGKGIRKDIQDLQEWGQIPRISRCGLGQTCTNPILTSIRNFRHLYEARIVKDTDYMSEFDMAASVKDACDFVGRIPNIR